VRTLLCLVVILVSIVSSFSNQDSSSVSLAWDPSPDASVAGYYVYYGTTSGIYTEQIDAGTETTVTISNLTPGLTYYFAVTAYATDIAESDFSNEISFIVPGVLRLSMTQVPFVGNVMKIEFPVVADRAYTVQASDDLVSWTDIWHAYGMANDWVYFLDFEWLNTHRRYYRLVWTEKGTRK
jgi:hypothetical protein